jgi:flagellin
MASIVTNVAAINAQRNLGISGMKLGKVLEKLSSGYRINRAADDAAGLGISENMRAQIRGNQQAVRNAQDGISMLQTAEGAMDEIHGMLQRMRELAVQGANDTLDTNARTSIGTELVQLRSEIDRIGGGTTFNGKSLLTGSLSGTLGGATGTDMVVNDVLTNATLTTVTGINVAGAQAGTYTMSNPSGTLVTMVGPNGLAQQLDIANYSLSGGAGTKVLNFDKLGVSITLTASAAQTDANVVAGLVDPLDDTIVVTGSGAAKMQVGANSTANDTLSISFSDVRATSASGLDLNTAGSVDWTSSATIVASNTASQALITQLDGAITSMNTARANLGASANRLEHTVASLGVAVENLTASESRVRDADIASLSSQMASNQILQQAGVSVLAQANQSSQSVLTLLR